MKTDIQPNNTVLTTPGGNIATSSSNAGSLFNITHPSGSNIQFTDGGTSSFNSTKFQELTLEDRYSTTYGDNSSFTKGTKETRVLGDSIDFTGPSSLLKEDLMDQWYEAYGTGYGSYKTQWQDNRMSLTDDDYPINTVFNVPAALEEEFIFCPELVDGTCADNKPNKPPTDDPGATIGLSNAQKVYESKMFGNQTAVSRDGLTEDEQQAIDDNEKQIKKDKKKKIDEVLEIYSDLSKNAKSIHEYKIKL